MVTRYVGFDMTEFEYIESFLTDMARKGLIFEKSIGAFYSFEKSEPIDRRYRLVPKNGIDGLDAEELDLYDSMGWKYDREMSGFALFHSDDPESDEIFTDSYSFKLRSGKMIMLTVMCSIFWIAGMIYIIGRPVFEAGGLSTYVQDNPIGFWLGLFFWIAIGGIFAYEVVIKPMKNVRRIVKCEEIDHEKPYEELLKSKKEKGMALAVIAIILLAVLAWTIYIMITWF